MTTPERPRVTYRDQTHGLRVQVEVQGFEPTPATHRLIEGALDTLRKVVGDFPVADLHVQLHRHARAGDFHVKTRLRLPKRILFTGERDTRMYLAFEKCVHKLVHKVKAYQDRLEHRDATGKRSEGTRHEMTPLLAPDSHELDRAVDQQDFAGFRRALAVYDDVLERQVARSVGRDPAAGRIGRDLRISEVVEEVYLTAFDRFGSRPAERLGSWLETLIDPSLRVLVQQHPDPGLEDQTGPA